MAVDLAGKTVLVTGAGVGIGREIALHFAVAGCRLALTFFRHQAETEQVAQLCREVGSPDVFVAELQLADDDSIRELAESVLGHFDTIDILVNNAGVVVWRTFVAQEFGELDEQVAVNLLGTMKVTWVFLPLVRDVVINVGSTAALHGTRELAPYCATKWGLRGFTKALALEQPGKRIVCVHPPPTATAMSPGGGIPPARVAEVVLAVADRTIDVESGGDVDVRDHAVD